MVVVRHDFVLSRRFLTPQDGAWRAIAARNLGSKQLTDDLTTDATGEAEKRVSE
jgi:hypothetical protein